MPFVVEAGEAKSDANAYASVTAFKDYCELRGITPPDTDALIQAALVKATDWIDANFASLFVGSRLTTGQALEWPRTGIAVDGKVPDNGVFAAVVAKACCALAVEAANNPLWSNKDPSEKQIIEDSIGPMIKKYSPLSPLAATIQKQYDEVRQILMPVVRNFGYLQLSR